MGIRFQCPNGHKLNVKADLAGKRASCPECGTKLVVPGASATPATPPAAAVLGAASPAGAVWFMQTPDGQQFGPATDAQFCEWIAAGRVGADSYVWREGWTEWKIARLAAALLPKPLAAVPVAATPAAVAAPVAAEPVAPIAPSVAPLPEPAVAPSAEPVAEPAVVADGDGDAIDEKAAPKANVYALRKQRQKKTQVTLAVLMLLTVLLLAGVLIWVIVSNSGDAPPEAQARATAQGSEQT